MKLVVLGAAGRTGRHVISQALASGDEVTAFVRKPGGLHDSDCRLVVRTGDAGRVEDLSIALRDQDAVISVLGSNRSCTPPCSTGHRRERRSASSIPATPWALATASPALTSPNTYSNGFDHPSPAVRRH
jgi:putative NADH-flavin reductase